MRTTIKDVAKASGVSPATVSLIINQKPVSISQETKEKVYKAIKDLHYRPNQLAISLVKNTTNTAGLLIPDSTNPFMADLVRRVRLKLIDLGILVITGNTDYDPSLTKKYLRAFADRRVDAIVITQLDFEKEEDVIHCADIVREIDVPIISYGRDIFNISNLSTIEVDQTQIGYLATRHLLSLGHRRIGCSTGNARLDVTRLRYEGYQKALKEFDIPLDPSLIYHGQFSIESGAESLSYLLGQNVTAIFAFNDLIAYGLYKNSKAYHLSIPENLSIVGVDDIPYSDIMDPPLTTIAQPMEAVADCIVDTVRKSIAGNTASVHQTFQPILKVRGSTAPC